MGYRVANATINSRGHSIAYGIDHGLMDAHCCGSLYNTLGIYNNESGCHLLGSWLVVENRHPNLPYHISVSYTHLTLPTKA